MNLDDLQLLHLRVDDALFIDFDGTLTEIGQKPDSIHLPQSVRTDLESLATKLNGAIAILSGRGIRDLVCRVPASLWRAGCHGLEILAPHQTPPSTTLSTLSEPIITLLRNVAKAYSGVHMELKGSVIALHFREAPQAEDACISAAHQAAEVVKGFVCQRGKMVVEVKPSNANKGAALRAFLEHPPFTGRRPVMLGDDAADEDAITAAQALGGIGVKIGPEITSAQIRATNSVAVCAWLAREAEFKLVSHNS